MTMSPRMHALKARELIERCGGLEESSGVSGISKPVLSNYQNPNHASTMSAKVIADLEAYCGEAIYSRALFDVCSETVDARCLRTEASEAMESVAVLHREVRLATVNGRRLPPNERDRLLRQHADAERELRDVGALLALDEGAA